MSSINNNSAAASLSSYFANGNNSAVYQQFCDQFKSCDPGQNGIPLAAFQKMCQEASNSGNSQLAQIDYMLCSNPDLFKQLSNVSTSENAADGIARVSLKDIQTLLGQQQQLPQTQQYPQYYPPSYPQVQYYPVYTPYTPTQTYYPNSFPNYYPTSYYPNNYPTSYYPYSFGSTASISPYATLYGGYPYSAGQLGYM